jgi:hypothetical protein
MVDAHNPSSQKSAHGLSIQKQVREILKGTVECNENTRRALESSRRCMSKQGLNLDSEPSGSRIRESF